MQNGLPGKNERKRKMSVYERAKKAADYLKSTLDFIPDTAVVLGSGLGAFGSSIKRINTVAFADIPEFPVSTVVGHEGRLILGRAGNKAVLAMQGRFHRYEGYDMTDVTLYVRVLSLLGVKNLVLTNAAGAVNTSFYPGDLMLITDHFSLFCDNPLFGKNDERFGPRFPSMSEAYSRELSEKAREAAKELSINLKEGVYCYTPGPTYETPAEIRAIRGFGCDACGMSTVPEAIVANHCGIKVMGISCITNMAAGITDKPLSHEEVMETSKMVEQKFGALMTALCSRL